VHARYNSLIYKTRGYLATTNNEEEWHTIELQETRHDGADGWLTITRNGILQKYN